MGGQSEENFNAFNNLSGGQSLFVILIFLFIFWMAHNKNQSFIESLKVLSVWLIGGLLVGLLLLAINAGIEKLLFGILRFFRGF